MWLFFLKSRYIINKVHVLSNNNDDTLEFIKFAIETDLMLTIYIFNTRYRIVPLKFNLLKYMYNNILYCAKMKTIAKWWKTKNV